MNLLKWPINDNDKFLLLRIGPLGPRCKNNQMRKFDIRISDAT